MKPITIELPIFGIEFSEEQARLDGDRIGKNRRAWERGRLPSGPEDVRPGDLVMPLEPYWMRGAGVVDTVDQAGNVWATYGPPETRWTSNPVRCCCQWDGVVIVKEVRDGEDQGQ